MQGLQEFLGDLAPKLSECNHTLQAVIGYSNHRRLGGDPANRIGVRMLDAYECRTWSHGDGDTLCGTQGIATTVLRELHQRR
jgi:hypothetical protein